MPKITFIVICIVRFLSIIIISIIQLNCIITISIVQLIGREMRCFVYVNNHIKAIISFFLWDWLFFVVCFSGNVHSCLFIFILIQVFLPTHYPHLVNAWIFSLLWEHWVINIFFSALDSPIWDLSWRMDTPFSSHVGVFDIVGLIYVNNVFLFWMSYGCWDRLVLAGSAWLSNQKLLCRQWIHHHSLNSVIGTGSA